MDNFNENKPQEGGFEINEDFLEELPEEVPAKKKNTLGQEIIEWLDVVCVAVIAVVIVFSLIFRVATIDGNSMLNTLKGQDKVIITNFNYTPKQGDIVVISRNIENSVEGSSRSDEPIIKRVIAVGGQTVDIKDGAVYVDGVRLEEDYLDFPYTEVKNVKDAVEFPRPVPEGYIFVLGDNRPDSLDSRSKKIGENGLIDTRYVLGHAVYRFFPFDKIGAVE